MKTHLILLTAAAFSAVSTLAIAETTPPATATTHGSSTGTSQNGLRVADKATVALKFVTVKAADFMTSKIIGTNVYNNQNETVGEIVDLVIENGKTITGVVVSVGGFLGMGESYVVLDPATVVLNQKDDTWKAFVDTSKDSLKNAPKFKYSKK
ncbi:MAG: PRC-barrel domain-containing protein [Nitrobacter sp.]|uniref:PRC-barrel domain-containing protein n=1 Tax=Nitrobacter sp. TaxID=29420 RepID=UPI002612CEAD|nr:PRC-barrel domain-containing protein [Nitrobacter sp.]MCV0387852.1 PRC-barrel domain-containing protein [Nitrobacter sp.]